jgi:hydrogenase expression/formation protein HypC
MCLGIPGQVIELVDRDAGLAKVDISGVRREISVALVDEPAAPIEVGDWVLIHVGFALARIDEDDARETLALLHACRSRLALAPRWQELIAPALGLAGHTEPVECRALLGAMRPHDPSGLVAGIEALLDRAEAPRALSEEAPEDPRPVIFFRALLDYARARMRGAGPEHAMDLAEGLRAVFPEGHSAQAGGDHLVLHVGESIGEQRLLEGDPVQVWLQPLRRQHGVHASRARCRTP